MFVVVCYDVPDNKRRTRIGKTLEGFGKRVQKSVFECDLTLKQLERLKQRLGRLVKPEEDSVRYYALCAECVPRIELVGSGPPVEETQLYFMV
jgi:CRISPR-associated protein Cas2